MRYFGCMIGLALCLPLYAQERSTAEPSLATIGVPAKSAHGKSDSAKLAKGQKYIIEWNAPLVVAWFSTDAGDVAINEIKGPHPYSDSIAITLAPADADHVVVVQGPFIYELTAKVSGTVYLECFPASGKDGKPLSKDDIVRRTIEVDAGAPAPPTPEDEQTTITNKLKAAYKLDGSTADDLAQLIDLYKTASAKTVYDKKVTTWQILFDTAQEARKSMIGEGLVNTRMVLGKEIFDKKWPRQKTAPMDEVGRKLAEKTYLEAASYLEKLKP